LQILKLNLSGLLLGASALLIGVGIGLQQIHLKELKKQKTDLNKYQSLD